MRYRIVFRWVMFLFLTCYLIRPAYAQVQVTQSMTLMGSRFQVTIVAIDSLDATTKIARVVDEITRIENLISEWKPGTQISMVNQNAGLRAVKVDPEVLALTQRGLFFSKLSDGAFDISIAAMDKVWQFDGSMNEMPTAAAIQQSIKNVGYDDIVLDTINMTVFLKRPGMKIGFGSIGKGYAADRARSLMQQMGVTGGIVDASGDIATWGQQVDGKKWLIGVRHPFKPGKMVDVLRFHIGSVATSGSYEKYAEIGGVRFSHIINPKTGYPSSGLVSVTVWGPSVEFANGLSTTIMVLGAEEGQRLLRQFPEYSGILITDKGKVVR